MDPGVVQIILALIALFSTVVGALVTIKTVNRRSLEVQGQNRSQEEKIDRAEGKLDGVTETLNGHRAELLAEIAELKAQLRIARGEVAGG